MGASWQLISDTLELPLPATMQPSSQQLNAFSKYMKYLNSRQDQTVQKQKRRV